MKKTLKHSKNFIVFYCYSYFGVLSTNLCVAVFQNDVFSRCHGNKLFSLKEHVFFIKHHKTCCQDQNTSHKHISLIKCHAWLPHSYDGCHDNNCLGNTDKFHDYA